MHNFELNDEQSMVRDTVARLVQEVVSAHALERDEHQQLAREGFDGLAELGMFGVFVDEASGGAGFGCLAYAVALEEIGKGCGSTGRLFVSQAGLCARALDGTGAGELLAGVCGGELAAYVGP